MSLTSILRQLEARGVTLQRRKTFDLSLRPADHESITLQDAENLLTSHPPKSIPYLSVISAGKRPYPVRSLQDLNFLAAVHLGVAPLGLPMPQVVEALRSIHEAGFAVHRTSPVKEDGCFPTYEVNPLAAYKALLGEDEAERVGIGFKETDERGNILAYDAMLWKDESERVLAFDFFRVSGLNRGLREPQAAANLKQLAAENYRFRSDNSIGADHSAATTYDVLVGGHDRTVLVRHDLPLSVHATLEHLRNRNLLQVEETRLAAFYQRHLKGFHSTGKMPEYELQHFVDACHQHSEWGSPDEVAVDLSRLLTAAYQNTPTIFLGGQTWCMTRLLEDIRALPEPEQPAAMKATVHLLRGAREADVKLFLSHGLPHIRGGPHPTEPAAWPEGGEVFVGELQRSHDVGSAANLMKTWSWMRTANLGSSKGQSRIQELGNGQILIGEVRVPKALPSG